MLEHIVGRPSLGWKRAQVLLVLTFWLWRLARGNSNGPRIFRRFNNYFRKFTPWQIVLTTLSVLYALRNVDSLVGLPSPEPLARLYSPEFYRATWITTAFDAAFASSIPVRPKFFRDIVAVLLTGYYLVYATEADEKLRRFRAICTVEMFRATWEKTSNPYIRAATFLDRPRLPIAHIVQLPRPASSKHSRPIQAKLFFARSERELAWMTELIVDLPGGGFVSMSPEHHEERLRRWSVRTGKPVLAIDYGKAPEYPYPWAIEECFDTYKVLMETKGSVIGMSGRSLSIILSGDSAGGNLVATTMYKILQHNNPPPHGHNLSSPSSVSNNPSSITQSRSPPSPLPLPLALVLSYPALDFNFTSWMTPSNLRVMRAEHEQSTTSLSSLLSQQKDHFAKKSPLSVVEDVKERRHKRQISWAGRLLSASNVVGPLSPVTKRGGGILGEVDEEGRWKSSIRSRSGSKGGEESPVIQRGMPHVGGGGSGSGSGVGSANATPGASTPTPIDTSTPRQSTSRGPTSFRARLLGRVSEVGDLAIDTGVARGSAPAAAGTSSSGTVNGGNSNGSRPNILSLLSSSKQQGNGGGELFSSDGEDGDDRGHHNHNYHHHHTFSSSSKKSKSPPEEADDEEGNSGDDYDDDDNLHNQYSRMEDKDKPLSARVIYSDGENGPDEGEVNGGGKETKGKKVPIGTRLTMTSRTAFFTDRIVSPSMMRAMAILYVGPKQNPDFFTDYYISPLLAPPRLLWDFPPVLMICGERDPFVDDTVIFGGKIREAKRMRKTDVRAGVGGESLRLSAMNPSAKERERERLLHENEADWVDMRLVEGWGHGFLQMTALLPRARLLINDLADWIGDRFAEANGAASVVPSGSASNAVSGSAIRPLRSSYAQKRANSPSKRPEAPRRTSNGSSGTHGNVAGTIATGAHSTSNNHKGPIFSLPSAPTTSPSPDLPSLGVSPNAKLMPMNRITSEDLSSSAQSTETERDAPLTFTPRKSRSPPSSFGDSAQPQPQRNATPTKPSVILGETRIGRTRPATPTITNNIPNRIGPNLATDALKTAGDVLKRTLSPSRQSPMPTGALNSAGGAVLLSEAELMRRRRADAVFGMGDMMTSSAVQERLSPAGGDGESGSKGIRMAGEDPHEVKGSFDGKVGTINANGV